MNMKNTWIITMEVTAINGAEHLDEKNTADALKEYFGADDVVITKVQLFEGADEDEDN